MSRPTVVLRSAVRIFNIVSSAMSWIVFRSVFSRTLLCYVRLLSSHFRLSPVSVTLVHPTKRVNFFAIFLHTILASHLAQFLPCNAMHSADCAVARCLFI